MSKIIICANTSWYLYNFRANLIKTLAEDGHSVLAVAPVDEYVRFIRSLDCRYVPFVMDNRGTHPVRDLLFFWKFLLLLKREKPDILLTYTVKPNIFGSLAARVCSVPVINNISGLGAVFIKTSWVTKLVMRLYHLSLARSEKVFFQNKDDQSYFVSSGLVQKNRTECLPGSGVDLDRFRYSPISKHKNKFRYLLVARMLWDKGVGEYVSVARWLGWQNKEIEFCLLGQVDALNPAAISKEQIDKWLKEGVICYLGHTDDVVPHLQSADCVVLPSYREGTPRSLLEAAAIGRPIVTTNSVGCRETVVDGESGFLCKARDADDLGEKMRQVLALSFEARTTMGLMGRKFMENHFDEKIVLNQYVCVINKIVARKRTN